MPMPALEHDESIDVSHPDLLRFYAYWLERRGDRAMPARADIDPLDFGWMLGRVSVVDVLPEPPRFRYRLVATRLTEHLGYEVTGRPLSDIPEPDMRNYLIEQYSRVADSGVPHTDSGDLLLDGRRWRSEAVYLPLSSDGTTVDMLLVGRITDRPIQPPRHAEVGSIYSIPRSARPRS